MKDAGIVKSPFFRLLLPLLVGILLQYFVNPKYGSVLFFALGCGITLLSFFIAKQKEYSLRWIFGLGLSLIIIAIGCFSTQLSQRNATYNYPLDDNSYRGIILDTPKEKQKSVAAEVAILDSDSKSNKKVVCYFEPDGVSRDLNPGDEIRFYGHIQPIKNTGNPDGFNYKRYMYNKGFSGSIYLPTSRWEPTFTTHHTPQTYALKCRTSILSFFKSLGLNDTEFALISALSLGYQDNIPEDIKESFRATGTAHILAVSGMHVGIIFAIVMFLLSFIRSSSKFFPLKYILAILFLWIYAFITGLPPSVIRACIMLTIFCIANIVHRKGFSYNTIFLSAFLILVFSPFSLFDIGFQLSFLAVFFIQYLYPRFVRLWKIENKLGRYIWQLFTLSLAAQIGTFPLCLYYFGYFPTYFFITNVCIPPIVSLITYLFIVIMALAPIPIINGLLMKSLVSALKFLIAAMTGIIRFFENLPLAKLEDLQIPLISVFVFIFLFFAITKWMETRRASAFIQILTGVCLLLIVPLAESMKPKKDQLWVYNKRDGTEVRWNKGCDEKTFVPDSAYSWKFIALKGKTFLSLSSDIWNDQMSEKRLQIDYLLITNGEAISVRKLSDNLDIKHIVLDGSLPAATSKKLIKECSQLGIPFYNVREQGALCLNF